MHLGILPLRPEPSFAVGTRLYHGQPPPLSTIKCSIGKQALLMRRQQATGNKQQGRARFPVACCLFPGNGAEGGASYLPSSFCTRRIRKGGFTTVSELS